MLKSFGFRFAKHVSTGDEVLTDEFNVMVPMKVTGVSKFELQGRDVDLYIEIL